MKKLLSLICAVATVFTFAACGTTNANGFTTVENGKFTVSTNTPFSPFEYAEGNTYYGVDIEIAKLFADKYNLELVIKDVPFETVVTEVSTGFCDIAMAGLTVSESRAKVVNFTDTYYDAYQHIIVNADDTSFDGLTTVAEVEAVISGYAQGTKVGFQNGTTSELYVSGDEDWGFTGFANVAPTGFESAALAVESMKNGELACVVVDAAPAQAIAAAQNGAVKVITVNLTEEQYAFAVNKGNPNLLTKFNAFLQEIKDNGTFQTILNKYFNGEGEKNGVVVA